MKKKDIGYVIAKSIKNNMWSSIKYRNTKGEDTYYWIAIHDIKIKNKGLVVDAFNLTKTRENNDGVLKNITIYFDQILNAELLPQTSYVRDEKLILKIEKHIEQLQWLKYDEYNDEILDYIETCVKHEEISYQEEKIMIEGIDQENLNGFKKNKKYPLSPTQIDKLTKEIEFLNKQKQKNKTNEVVLAINYLGINTKRGLYVIVYKKVTFNPVGGTLVLDDDFQFEYQMKINKDDSDFTFSLRSYLDIETDYFTKLYLEDPKKASNFLTERLSDARSGEAVDESPYFMNLVRSYDNVITNELRLIKYRKATNTLNIPLEAFFGKMSNKLLKRKRDVNVMIVEEKINIDQLRVIYNALVQPITYVQGPPGTGKTQTILNILISSFFNGQTVLVSSNNNKPIDDVFNKLTTIKNPYFKSDIPFPVLRLGNKEQVLKSLNNIKELYKISGYYNIDENKLKAHDLSNKDKTKEINELLQAYEDRMELKENIESMKGLLKTDNLAISTKIQSLINEKKDQLSKIPNVTEEEVHAKFRKPDSRFFSWLFFTSIKYIQRLKEPKYDKLHKILDLDDEEEQIKQFNNFTSSKEGLKLLQRIFPIILTTNQSAYRLGPQGPNFDLTIIDEAGQCSIGYALYAISRANRLLLVGDIRQLRPVITIPPETNEILFNKYEINEAYNYVNNSILFTMQRLDQISKSVTLTYHYRSRKRIINFSNQKYYGGILKFSGKDDVEDALSFINVNNKERPIVNHLNEEEIKVIIKDIKKRYNTKVDKVGIITPFVNQKNYLKEYLKESNLEEVEVGTVHTFQGDEKEIIYFSLSTSKYTSEGAFDWLKNNEELINVAVTRARDNLVVVGDYAAIKNRSSNKTDILDLLQYVRSNGQTIPYPVDDGPLGKKRQFKSSREEEMLETLTQILSIDQFAKYVVEDHVRIASILDKFTSPKKYDFGLKAEFDFVIFKKILKKKEPIFVIELDGPEHKTSSRRRNNDKLKEKICKEHGIQLIRITNDYSRRYLYVKDLLKDLLN